MMGWFFPPTGQYVCLIVWPANFLLIVLRGTVHSLYPCPTPIPHSARGKITNSELVALFSAIVLSFFFFFFGITVCVLKHSMLEGASVSVLLPGEPSGRVLGTWSRWARNIAKELPARTLAHRMPPSHEGSHPVDFKTRVQKQNKLPFAIQNVLCTSWWHLLPVSLSSANRDLTPEKTQAFQVPNWLIL